MTDLDEFDWAEPPLAGDEAATLLGSLDRQRATLAWKTGGLDASGLSARLAPSTITLGGLLKHLAAVEDSHFTRKFLDRQPGPPWNTADWAADPDWDWHPSADETPEQLRALWRGAVARSRALVDSALSQGGLDQLGRYPTASGQHPSLRRLLIDLIEEYARHVGQADLIRESIDGLTGEDPPWA